MIKEGKFGPQEAISLITITIVARVFFTSPSVITRFVGSAGWLMTLISAATALVIFSLVYLLLRKWPGKNLIDIYELSAGRFIGSIFSLALFAGFLIDGSALLREFTEVMKVYVLPVSPPSYIMGLFLIGVLIVSIYGLETQARLARVLAPVLFIGLVAVLILAGQNYSIHRLSPFFGYGLDKIIIRGIRRNSVYGYSIIAAIIAGSLQGLEHIKKVGYASIIISAILISGCVLCFSLTFPYYTAQEITSPLYEMVSLIDYGRFFQRLDPIFLFTWNIATLLAVTVEVYMAASIYCKVFRIQDIRPIIASMCVLTFTIAITPSDLEEVALGYVNRLREYLWLGVLIPVIITLLLSTIKDRKKRKPAKTKKSR